MIALDLLADRQIPDWLGRYIELGYTLAGLDDHITIMVVPRIQYAAVALAAGMVSGLWERFIQEYLPSEGAEVLLLNRQNLVPGKVECLESEDRVRVVVLARTKRYRGVSMEVGLSHIVPFKSPGCTLRHLNTLPLDLNQHQNRRNIMRFLATGVELCAIVGLQKRLKHELAESISSAENPLCFNDIVRCKGVPDSLGMPGRVCVLGSSRKAPRCSDGLRGIIVETDARVNIASFLQHRACTPVFLIDRTHPEAAQVAQNIDDYCISMAPEKDLPFGERDLPPLTEIMVLKR